MKYNSLFLSSLSFIDESWNGFLIPEVTNLLKDIERKILKDNLDYTPVSNNALKFLSTSINNTKVIILGQDPYPQKGVATGRAFEVGTLKSWKDKFSNTSLKNIIRAIYYAYSNRYLKYSEIKGEIGKLFDLKPPYELFVTWEEQGVLLLNTSFTCQVGKPNSHEKYWELFTFKVLNYIAKVNRNIIWFIWGNNAKEIIKGIEIKHKIESMHPMMCYNKPDRDQDFLFGEKNAFKETKDLINWLG